MQIFQCGSRYLTSNLIRPPSQFKFETPGLVWLWLIFLKAYHKLGVVYKWPHIHREQYTKAWKSMDYNLLPLPVFLPSSIFRIHCPSGLPPHNQLLKLKGSINGLDELSKPRHTLIKTSNPLIVVFIFLFTILNLKKPKVITNKTAVFPYKQLTLDTTYQKIGKWLLWLRNSGKVMVRSESVADASSVLMKLKWEN